MIKSVVLVALVFIAVLALLRCVTGKNRVHDCYIQRDYEKFKRLDEQLELKTTAGERSTRERHRDSVL